MLLLCDAVTLSLQTSLGKTLILVLPLFNPRSEGIVQVTDFP